eukprot:gene1426-1575_t
MILIGDCFPYLFCFFLILLLAELGHLQKQEGSEDANRRQRIQVEIDETMKQLQEEYGNYKLRRLKPGKINIDLKIIIKLAPKSALFKLGREVPIKLSDGKLYIVKTLSRRPPVFEVNNFLSHKECDYMVNLAERQGLSTSVTIGEDDNILGLVPEEYENATQTDFISDAFKVWDVNKNGEIDMAEAKLYLEHHVGFDIDVANVTKLMQVSNVDSNQDGLISKAEFEQIDSTNESSLLLKNINRIKEIWPESKSRHSQQVFIDHTKDSVLRNYQQRLVELTRLPSAMVKSSEDLQIVKYEPGGHYNCHLDSMEVFKDSKTCCHIREAPQDCQICRFMTVLYFLNDVELGGETAFPIADNATLNKEAWEEGVDGLCNLARNCQKSNIVVKPKKGKAILWYNHVGRKQSGWLGQVDFRSYHGGCDVIRGVKWIANNWINVSPFRDADLRTWAHKIMEDKYPDIFGRNKNEQPESSQIINDKNKSGNNGQVSGEDAVEQIDHSEL